MKRCLTTETFNRADGYRVEKDFAGGAGVSPVPLRKYILDGVHVILEKEIIGEGEPVTKVCYIPGVATIYNPTSEHPIARYDLHDALGSVIAMTDEEQNLTALYQYDAWGNELLATEDIPNPYRWCGLWGYYRDPDAQMYLLGMRWYEPFTGRFLTPVPGGVMPDNCGCGGTCECEFEFPYEYSKNNPVNLIDPNGLQPWNIDVCYGWCEKVVRFCTPLSRKDAVQWCYSCCLDAGDDEAKGKACITVVLLACLGGRGVNPPWKK